MGSLSRRSFRNVVPHHFGCAFLALAVAAVGAPPKSVEPRLTSIDPFGVTIGQKYSAVVRGTGLGRARDLWFPQGGITAKVVRVEEVEVPQQGSKPPIPSQAVHVEISVDATAKPGSQPFRVLTEDGVTNEMQLRVLDAAVMDEATAFGSVNSLPAAISGRISKHGEADEYCLQASAGQALAFEAISGSRGFDPVLSLFDTSGSWFDPHRRNLVAGNDDPLVYPGMPQDPKLVHRIQTAGRYCVRVQGFMGRGSPDSVYLLRVAASQGEQGDLRPPPPLTWEERRLTRSVGDNWLIQVAARGGLPAPKSDPETYKPALEGATEIPTMKVPGILIGQVARPGETHVIRLQVEKAQKLTIEVETPAATAPFFNPVVRLMEPGGTEIVTSVYTRLNNNNLKVFKALQSKVTFDLQSPGLYTLQVHDLTTDFGRDDFKYRVLVREQIPHVGSFSVLQDSVNLTPGSTRTLTLKADREEGFKGTLAFSVENLPRGVTAITGLENPDERPALPNAGKMERYRAQPQTASVLLVAGADAVLTETPVMIKVVARLIVDGSLSEPVAVSEVPLMVVARRPS